MLWTKWTHFLWEIFFIEFIDVWWQNPHLSIFRKASTGSSYRFKNWPSYSLLNHILKNSLVFKICHHTEAFWEMSFFFYSKYSIPYELVISRLKWSSSYRLMNKVINKIVSISRRNQIFVFLFLCVFFFIFLC